MTYLHTDHLNTPRIGTDGNEVVVWCWDSDAFGQTAPDTDPDSDGVQTVVNLRFPGQIQGGEATYYYNYFRDYDPGTGRYLESDPIGLNGGINTYLYVLGNPINYFDDIGLAPSGKITDLGGGNRVRIDNPHVTGQQKHAHFETPKGNGVVNQDGTQSRKNSGSLENMNKKLGSSCRRKDLS